MQITSKRLDYENYGFEDFLQDPFFVASVNRPTKKSEAFWREEEKHLKKYNEYLAAREYLLSIHESKQLLSDDEVNALQKRIDESIVVKKKVLPFVRLFRVAGIAASFLLLCTFGYLFYRYSLNEEADIMTFAMQDNTFRNGLSDETVLILSDEKKVKMQKDGSVVNYEKNSQAVTVEQSKEEYIEKEQIATYNELITPRGKRCQLVLADGSKVWLNTGTRVVYPKNFSKDRREIFIDGEIYIDVKPDKERPFYVKTNDLNIRVLGTKFNVTSYSGKSCESVVLVSGSVSIDNHDGKTEKVILKPSQMYLQNGNDVSVKDVEVQPYISWIDGIYVYKEEMIVRILSNLSEYYGVQMEYNNVNPDMLYSGKLDLRQSIDEVLKGLKNIVPMEYVIENGKYIINFKENLSQ